MGTFVRRGALIRAQLEAIEVELLRMLHAQLTATLDRPSDDDPVHRRLFPPLVLGDQDAEAQLRALVGGELLDQRRRGLEAFVALLDRGTTQRGRLRIDLDADDALLVLGVLNDLRLAIGAAVDIDALDRDRLADDDPAAYPLAIMDHLAWLQEQLLAIIDPPSVAHGS